MGYLRKRDTGAVTEYLDSGALEYQVLKAMKFPSQVTALTPTQSGILSGETGGVILAGSPVWEEVAEEDAGFPDPTGGRVKVVVLGPAATGSDETTELRGFEESGVAGTLTDVEYVPSAAIVGVNANTRSITLNQVTVSGTSSPARAVTALAAVQFNAGTSNAGGNVPTPLTISTAAFSAVPPDALEVVSAHVGTGMADPGGVLYAIYTRA